MFESKQSLKNKRSRRFNIRLRLFFLLFISLLFPTGIFAQTAYLRVNQIGYPATDAKKALAFARAPLAGDFLLIDAATGRTVFSAPLKAVPAANWGADFKFYYELDFSAVRVPGRHFIRLEKTGAVSREFSIGEYPAHQEDLLFFMRQQRCGYNPFLDMVCHRRDGRSVYAPVPDGSFIDASGGWHDAGDQLKYLITASNATARMLLAFELEKRKFADRVDEYGRARPNGIPDVLDEAKWGLDWILKLHPKPDWLFHQVADDRDHRGFKLPDQDNADYGWGANSYRPVYFADGRPQGLREFKSRSTGVANIAGRSAAALALASRIWKNDLKAALEADRFLKAAVELYEMGRRREGFQQGNSYGAPYRYNEDTWADDMEWAAAELYKTTRQPGYLTDAKRYAKLAGAASWMEHETADHYQFYPFTNVGHFALYAFADAKTKKELAGYYRRNIEKIIERSKTNSYRVGVPFLWCSNNLVVAYITQVLLYERMTGDLRFHESAVAHRDWLFGRNPWGTTMFEGLPAGGEFPEDTHLPTVQLLKKRVVGGLVDGPILTETYKNLRGLRLNEADEFAEFQPRDIVYHDDVGDYSTNEPTMDGTADAILMMAGLSGPGTAVKTDPRFKYEQGAIVRGPTGEKKLALVFTGDEYADGAIVIADTLKKQNIKAAFFFTGRFYRNPAFKSAILRLKRDGHFLGAHSDAHLLYADWNDRRKLLVSRAEFEEDLNKNYTAMRAFGISKRAAPFFLPPFEWFNQEIGDWTSAMGLQLVNFTSGTGSNADYTTPSMKNYVPSEAIFSKIKNYEAKDASGLNGFILLLHIGVGPERTDKFYDRLDELIDFLKSKNYELVRIERLLR
jgi:peptidoglycan/xylan/chitin deacetylase (PgdA/CDA1 family)